MVSSTRCSRRRKPIPDLLVPVDRFQKASPERVGLFSGPEVWRFPKTSVSRFDTLLTMKPLGLVIARVVTVLFALTMLIGYVCFRQEIGPFAPEPDVVDFPEVPSSPAMFNTSKSGALLIPVDEISNDGSTLLSGTKSAVLTNGAQGGTAALTAESIDALIEKAAAAAPDSGQGNETGSPVLMPGSKSINMPIFNTRPPRKGTEEPAFEVPKDSVPRSQTPPGGSPNDPFQMIGSTKLLVPVIAPTNLKQQEQEQGQESEAESPAPES